MNVKVKDGEVTVTLLKPEEAILEKARNIGIGLAKVGQDTGRPLVDAIDNIIMLNELRDDVPEEPATPSDRDETGTP